MINKISDLSIGQTYYLCFIKNEKFANKVKLLAIINETESFVSNKTEIYVELYERNKLVSNNLFYAQEVGIGNTKLEAKNNYAKFKYEQTHNSINSLKKLIQ